MTRITRAICATGALLSLTALATMAYADGRDYNDGPVQNCHVHPHRRRPFRRLHALACDHLQETARSGQGGRPHHAL